MRVGVSGNRRGIGGEWCECAKKRILPGAGSEKERDETSMFRFLRKQTLEHSIDAKDRSEVIGTQQRQYQSSLIDERDQCLFPFAPGRNISRVSQRAKPSRTE